MSIILTFISLVLFLFHLKWKAIQDARLKFIIQSYYFDDTNFLFLFLCWIPLFIIS